MSPRPRHAGNLDLHGGRLCLDFVNTVDWREGEQSVEFLNRYEDLVAWGRHLDITPESEAHQLHAVAAADPHRAADVLRRAIALREAIHRIFLSIARNHRPDFSDLEQLNESLRDALSRLRLVAGETGVRWEWFRTDRPLDQPLWPVARDAADLLTSGASQSIRECSDEECGWLFLDTSRNHSRRWCSMKDCGNRAKARRHYRRARETENTDRSGKEGRHAHATD